MSVHLAKRKQMPMTPQDAAMPVFVFGSNLGGVHGAGAAKFAFQRRGAILGEGIGHHGNSYAIPTKDRSIAHTLPGLDIVNHVEDFLEYAKEHPELEFQVTRIGCGLAGLKDEQIAPLFYEAPANCSFDTAWQAWLPVRFKFWGSF